MYGDTAPIHTPTVSGNTPTLTPPATIPYPDIIPQPQSMEDPLLVESSGESSPSLSSFASLSGGEEDRPHRHCP